MKLPFGALAQSTLRTFASLMLRLVLLAGTLLVLTRLLRPAEFGMFAGITAISLMAGALSTLGTHLVVMRDTSVDATKGRNTLEYASSATLIGTLLLLGGFLLVAFLWIRPTGIPGLALLAIGIADVVAQPFLQLASAYLLGTDRVARSQLLMVLPFGLRLMGALFLLWLEPRQALALYCGFYVAAPVLALVLARLLYPEARAPLHRWRLPNRAEWADAGGYAVLNLTATGPGELDKTLSLRLLPAEITGIYAAGSRVVGALVLPVTALMLAALPRLFAGERTHSPALLPAIFAASCTYGLAAGAGIYLAAPLLAALFGPGYESLAEVLALLALAVPGMAMRLSGTSTLMTRGRPWLRVATECLGLCVLGSTAVFLSSNSPLSAMPIALASSEWTMALFAWGSVLCSPRRNKVMQAE